ncbi:Uncharacterised protein [Gemella morbillorum]|uniref:hypothetical protein n=1 Tax=Gemella morbillorum TaxID=29391 RepID=UPI000DA3E835|nr:hypothetical protein [Gemella morbillorum]UBH80974.1 hypothetical protein LA320_01320 [Gemella morbillorum]SQH54731.1 Uncharacterised protein [Gemella morbillorum]
MVDINQIINLLYNKLNLNINYSELISESYLLTIDELDSQLLPTNFYDVMKHKSYQVIFFYYADITVYIFYNPDMTKKLLTGILKQERLVFSKYEKI